MSEGQHNLRKQNRLTLVVLGVLALAGLGFGVWRSPLGVALPGRDAATTQAAPVYQTTTVRLGDVAVTASGTGTLVAAQSLDLGFATPGTIATLNVQLGDVVKKGQVLAVQNGIDQLQLAVQTSQLALTTAQQNLATLQSNAAISMAQADAAQAAAQKSLADAQANLHAKSDPTCDANTTVSYYYKYARAQEAVDTWQGYLTGGKTGYSTLYIQQVLNGLIKTRDLAQANWQFCQGYTDQQIAQSQADLQFAQATVDQTTRTYQSLKTNAGVDPVQLAIDAAAVKDAQAQLDKAQANLAGATITAPMDATVTAVNGVVGQASPAKGALITLKDFSHPQIQVNIDETDLGNFAVGCNAQVSFTSIPNQTFAGVVSQVSPSLVTVRSVSVVQGLVDFSDPAALAKNTLAQGLTTTVNVTCSQANNVPVIPLQALYQTANQPAYVYVLNALGRPEKHEVTVGIKTSAFVEIKSGLKPGDRVITSPVK